MKLQEIVTLAIALYGATLSTLAMLLAVRRDRRSLSVRLSTVMPTHGARLGAPMLRVEVTNTGHRNLVVDAPQLRVEGEKMVIALIDVPGLADFPKQLTEGERASVIIGYQDLAAGLQSRGHTNKAAIYATCKDSAQNSYRSETWSVDVQEWLSMG